MARLTTRARKALPKSDFALPAKRGGGKGGYPIPDKSHARNALQRVSEFGSSAQKAEVREKVHKKFPGIGKSHHSPTERVHSRGEMTHGEFESLDHGRGDHMRGRR